MKALILKILRSHLSDHIGDIMLKKIARDIADGLLFRYFISEHD